MPIRTSDATWHGNLRDGNGHMRFGGGAYDGAFTWSYWPPPTPGVSPWRSQAT